jgi:hypothetical protein
MLGESLRLLAAKDMLGLVGPDAMRSEAADALQEGIDSPSVRQLAGMRPIENDKVRGVFDTALRELDIKRPSRREAAILVATDVASRIIESTVSPYDGAKEVWNIVRRFPLEHLPELDTFVYGASEWDERPQDQKAFADGIVAAAHDLVVRGQRD